MSWYRLLLIAIIGTLVFNFYPLIETFITSLKNMNGSFIGFTNYKILFSSDEFRQSIINTLYMAVLGVGLNVPLAFIIASVLNSIAHGKGIYRVIFLLPMVMSMITVVTLFKYMMMPSADGVFNYILSFFGVAPKLWLNDPKAARECVVLIAVWKGIGYNIILFFAGLQEFQQICMRQRRLMEQMHLRDGFILQFRHQRILYICYHDFYDRSTQTIYRDLCSQP